MRWGHFAGGIAVGRRAGRDDGRRRRQIDHARGNRSGERCDNLDLGHFEAQLVRLVDETLLPGNLRFFRREQKNLLAITSLVEFDWFRIFHRERGGECESTWIGSRGFQMDMGAFSRAIGI